MSTRADNKRQTTVTVAEMTAVNVVRAAVKHVSA